VNVMVPCELIVQAEKTGELELIIQQCVVFEVRDQAELMISDDITWNNHMKILQQTR